MRKITMIGALCLAVVITCGTYFKSNTTHTSSTISNFSQVARSWSIIWDQGTDPSDGLCVGYRLNQSDVYGWPVYYGEKKFGEECTTKPDVHLYPVAFVLNVLIYTAAVLIVPVAIKRYKKSTK